MSERVVELPTQGVRSAEFERTPPQDLAAEQSVLGGMLLSKDAIADVVEVVRAGDFYRPAHQTIFDVIVDLYGKGEPADPITVTAELTRLGEIGRIGGGPYVHTLLASVPTAANAGFYARIVAEQAILRRLVEAGTRIVQLGYGANGQVDDIVDRAQQTVYDVTERRTSEDYVLLEQLMQPTMDELEAIGSRSGQMSGVPTGFVDLDGLTNGLHPGQLIVIAGRPGLGKALALDTALPTPTGWTTMGEVAVGDDLLGADGRPTRVTAATAVMTGRPCFELHFSDGTRVVADAEHEWPTTTRAQRRTPGGSAPVARTTAAIAASVRRPTADARAEHAVRTTAPLQLPSADLLVPPYVLGAWLGDGHSAGARLTTTDPEIVMHIEAEGIVVREGSGAYLYGLSLPVPDVGTRCCVVCGGAFTPRTSQVRTCGRSCGGRSRGLVRSVPPTCPDCGALSSGLRRCHCCNAEHGTLQARLRTLGVLGDKHIPAAYLRADEQQRRALLAGLLDTDGTVTVTGNVQFAVTSRRLAADVHELVHGLGHRCTMTTKRVPGRREDSSTCFTLNFSTDERVFRLERKHLAHKQRSRSTPSRVGVRFITDVQPVASVPVRCVQVDAVDHLYLATRSMIPTHNSTLGLDIARSASVKHSLPSAIFSLEMSKTEITMRLLSAEARVPLHHMRSGTMTDDDWNRLARRMGEVAEAPLYIDDSPNLTMMEIRAKARRLRQRHDLRLIVIDYLQLMTANRKVESRQQEVSELSRSLKLLAKELDVPVIAMSQLNRGAEQRTDKKPQLADLRESGCLPASARVLRADTGASVSLGELFASGARDVPVWSLDDSLRLVARPMTHVFATGRRALWRLRLASGKHVEATANHPLLTPQGWQPLGALTEGDRVAVPRHVPAPLQPAAWSDEQVVEHARRMATPGSDGGAVTAVAGLPKRSVRLFLRALWQAAGVRAGGPVPVLRGEPTVLDEVSRLLLRFGISEFRSDGRRQLSVVEPEDCRRFLREIALAVTGESPFGSPLPAAAAVDRPSAAGPVWPPARVAKRLSGVPAGTLAPTWQAVRRIVTDTSRSGTTLAGAAPLAGVATALAEVDLDLVATNDVLFDEVVAIERLGEADVFDATVPGTHNFVADGVVVHNSIEQDADVVVLLHREDAYEKESPRAGEADFIVAKHRNGPTATITVAFQGHYSRFVDMSPA